MTNATKTGDRLGMIAMPYAWYVKLPLEFPEGVHFGKGKQFNSLAIARDGTNTPVLNGTSLAGVLRSIWTDYLVVRTFEMSSRSANAWAEKRLEPSIVRQVEGLFGRAVNDRQARMAESDSSGDCPSCVKVSNYAVVTGGRQSEKSVYHQRNRHRGTVLDGSLYEIETCPPGSFANVSFWVFDSDQVDEEQVESFVRVTVAAFQNGVHVGGKSNRGFGRAVLNPENFRVRRFDLSDLQDHAAQLDAHRQWRAGTDVPGTQTFACAEDTPQSSVSNNFVLEIVLQVPPGQDILVGSEQSSDTQIDPLRTLNVAGLQQWRLPGSSLRGLFRNWMHRLAAREAMHCGQDAQPASHDAADDYLARLDEGKYNGQMLGWCGVEPDARRDFQIPNNWRIVSLFGSCFSPGRIKITDGFASCSHEEIGQCSEAQKRVHVAVDRITGGAAQGLLFDNRVLAPIGKEIVFPIRIAIADPNESEIRWLVQTLIALHIGLLRVGSSKASGRLEIAAVSQVTGAHKSTFLGLITSLFPASVPTSAS